MNEIAPLDLVPTAKLEEGSRAPKAGHIDLGKIKAQKKVAEAQSLLIGN